MGVNTHTHILIQNIEQFAAQTSRCDQSYWQEKLYWQLITETLLAYKVRMNMNEVHIH